MEELITAIRDTDWMVGMIIVVAIILALAIGVDSLARRIRRCLRQR